MLYHDMAECPVSYTAWHEFQFATILVVISNASNTEPILECGSSSTCRFLFPLFLHVVLISVFGYCVLMVLFLWSKFIAGPKLVYVAYEVPTRVNFCCTNADNYPRASLYGCATKGCCPLPDSAVRRDRWYPKHCPFLHWFRTGNSHRREIWLSLESLVLLFMDKAIETIRAFFNKKQPCF